MRSFLAETGQDAGAPPRKSDRAGAAVIHTASAPLSMHQK